jgi:hypothetical protein
MDAFQGSNNAALTGARAREIELAIVGADLNLALTHFV